MKETILDNYAFNQLTDEEKVWLKNNLAQDPSFQQELDFHADVVQGLIYYKEQKIANQKLKNKIGQIDAQLEQEGFFASNLEKTLIENIQLKGEQELKQAILNVDQTLEQEGFFNPTQQIKEKKPIISLFKIAVAAASILLVTTLGWQWINQTTIDPQEQYLLAFQPYKNTLSKSVQLELSEHGFGGNPQKEPLNQLLEAMNAYDIQDYQKASNLLTTVHNNGIDNSYQPMTQFYLALSYMGNNQHQEAISLLIDLTKQKSTQKEVAHWYLALSYLKIGTLDKAKTQLQLLMNSKEYKERANVLIQQL